MLSEILKNIGFEAIESQIYLILLRFGSRPASFVARKLGINRITTYQYLKRLAQRGIIGLNIRSGIQYFSAESIDDLCAYIDSQKRSLDKQLGDLRSNHHLFRNIEVCPESDHPCEIFYGSRMARSCMAKIRNSHGPVILAGTMCGFPHDLDTFSDLFGCRTFTSRIRKLCLDKPSMGLWKSLSGTVISKRASSFKSSSFPDGIMACLLSDELFIFEMEDEKIRIIHIASTSVLALFRKLILSIH